MSVRLAVPLACLLLAACGGGGEQKDGGSSPAAIGETARPAEAPGGYGGTQSRTIFDNAARSPDHGRLVAAIKAAGLEKVLSGAGPYTVFAPTDAAFASLPSGSAEGLLRPEAKAQLTGILTYHVVPGLVTAADLKAAIQRRGGKTELATVGGGKLTASETDGGVMLTDAKGGTARVTHVDAMQSNGVVHVVDAVLMPK